MLNVVESDSNDYLGLNIFGFKLTLLFELDVHYMIKKNSLRLHLQFS